MNRVDQLGCTGPKMKAIHFLFFILIPVVASFEKPNNAEVFEKIETIEIKLMHQQQKYENRLADLLDKMEKRIDDLKKFQDISVTLQNEIRNDIASLTQRVESLEKQLQSHDAQLKNITEADRVANIESADVIVKPSSNMTALHVAASFGRLEEVRGLLRNGSNIEAEDSKKFRPLHLAAHHGKADVVQELLANGAEVDSIGPDGNTPLHLAAQESREDCVDILLNNGANIEAKDIYGETPLQKSCYAQNRTELVELLLFRGANIENLKKSRKTSLHVAAINGNMHFVKLLVEKGANVHAKTFDGKTPADLGLSYEHQDIVNYLKLHM